jgi:hypothetical protein
MSTIELQNYLVNKIISIEDPKFLAIIQELIDSAHVTDKPYSLSQLQRDAIQAGEQDLSNGKTIHHNVVMEQTTKWLKK